MVVQIGALPAPARKEIFHGHFRFGSRRPARRLRWGASPNCCAPRAMMYTPTLLEGGSLTFNGADNQPQHPCPRHHQSDHLGGLSDVVLVGHSGGGMVIAGVAEAVAERLAAYVVIDGFVPEDGEYGFAKRGMKRNADTMEMVNRSGQGWRMPAYSAASFGVNAGDQAKVDSLLTDHPLARFTELPRLTGKRETIARRHYIRAETYPNDNFAELTGTQPARPAGRSVGELRPRHHDRPTPRAGHRTGPLRPGRRAIPRGRTGPKRRTGPRGRTRKSPARRRHQEHHRPAHVVEEAGHGDAAFSAIALTMKLGVLPI